MWNGWRYWRIVMWWVSWRFRQSHAKTIRRIPSIDAGLLMNFVYPVIPGNYESRYKFLQATTIIFSPKAYRDYVIGARVWPLKLRPVV